MPKYITHPLIKENTVENRLYQEVLAARILERGNSLVVAPTALGKTIVAVILAAHMLEKNPEKKILFLAPTKPLAVQHEKTFKKFMQIPEEKITLMTGSVDSKKRAEIWDNASIINATPQTIENDLLNNRISFDNIALCIFDEAHRAVKEYSYVYIAGKFASVREKPLIVGLTASPGSTEEKIQEVCKNLFIENIEIKKTHDVDVRPYTKEIDMEWVRVNLPQEFVEIQKLLVKFMREQIVSLKKFGVAHTANLKYYNSRRLLEMQAALRRRLMDKSKSQPSLYAAVSKMAALLKVSHAQILLETQGIYALHDYFEKMSEKSGKADSSKALKSIMSDENIAEAIKITEDLCKKGINHPKMEVLGKILQRQFKQYPESKVIVFNHYRDSIKNLVTYLETIENVRPKKFIGQATKESDKGMSQKEQSAVIEELKEGKYNTLVASSVAEEGLDIPSVDLVVFYEPVPSEIRTIQRRGRTGRFEKGKVIILMARGTRDEAFYWASASKEKRMQKTLTFLQGDMAKENHLKQKSPEKQMTLHAFDPGMQEKIIIYADSREQASPVLKALDGMGCFIKTKQLEVGDYILSTDIVIERKTINDFITSLIDGRLFTQLIKMAEYYEMPLMLVEGDAEELFAIRNVHRNAIIGALTSIALNYRIPILFTKDANETAEYIYVTAKREQLGKGKDIRLRTGRKGLKPSEMQQFIVESFPLIGPNTAKTLLRHFESIKNIVNADVNELQNVENIGEKKAKKLRHVLDADYNKETKK